MKASTIILHQALIRLAKGAITAWEEWEAGEQTPGKVLATMKTAGLPQILQQLAASGWSPAAE